MLINIAFFYGMPWNGGRHTIRYEPGAISLCPEGETLLEDDMSRRKRHPGKRDNRRAIRQKIGQAVSTAFPGCTADFCGGVERSRMAKRGRTFGFRVKDARTGKFRSNLIWVNPDYQGEWSVEWVLDAVKRSNR